MTPHRAQLCSLLRVPSFCYDCGVHVWMCYGRTSSCGLSRISAIAPSLVLTAVLLPCVRLAIDDDHLAVLHTRGAQDSGAGSFLRFVAACYLTFR
jgi:hypothetical protein